MSFLVDARNAISLICRGEWDEFFLRVRIYFGSIDLKNMSTDELNLPESHSHEYSDSGGIKLRHVLDAMKITAQDAIIDFGSGKGGALITFSKYPFIKITGVEIAPELVAIAEQNLSKLKIQQVQMVVCDAARFTELEDYNYFYFFSPFPGNVMRTVIKNIDTSLQKKPRKAFIIYCNPEYHDEVIDGSSFTKVAEFHHRLGYYIYSNT